MFYAILQKTTLLMDTLRQVTEYMCFDLKFLLMLFFFFPVGEVFKTYSLLLYLTGK